MCEMRSHMQSVFEERERHTREGSHRGVTGLLARVISCHLCAYAQINSCNQLRVGLLKW